MQQQDCCAAAGGHLPGKEDAASVRPDEGDGGLGLADNCRGYVKDGHGIAACRRIGDWRPRPGRLAGETVMSRFARRVLTAAAVGALALTTMGSVGDAAGAATGAPQSMGPPEYSSAWVGYGTSGRWFRYVSTTVTIRRG